MTEQNQTQPDQNPMTATRRSNTDEKTQSTLVIPLSGANKSVQAKKDGSNTLNFRDCTYFSNQTSFQLQDQYQSSGK